MMRRDNMKGTTAIFAIAVFVITLLSAGCIQLKAEQAGRELPSRGYGSFRMETDDPGPIAEVDEGGVLTGRQGFMWDVDQRGKPTLFYQIPKPTAGMVSLSLDVASGEITGGLAAAMARLHPGQTHYAIPLQSLTTWIKSDQAVGYMRSQYVDQPNTLVYNDRVHGGQLEAPLTGASQTTNFQLVSVGVVNAQAAIGGAKPVAP